MLKSEAPSEEAWQAWVELRAKRDASSDKAIPGAAEVLAMRWTKLKEDPRAREFRAEILLGKN